MFCIFCGAQLPEGAKFCTHCGKPAQSSAAAPTHKSPSSPTSVPVQKTVPVPSHKSRWGVILLLAIVLLIVAALVGALMIFHPWSADLANPQNTILFSSTPSSEPADDVQQDPLAAQDADWSIYDGNWSAGAYRFSLLTQGNELTATLLLDSPVQFSYDLSLLDAYPLLVCQTCTLRLFPYPDGALRVSIDGEQVVDAIRSNNLPPQVSANETPTLNASDSGYLFYSPSTGTRSTNGNIPDDQPDLHFWPLDQFAISTADLDRLTREEIDIIRNEAFARHGYVFTSDGWMDFFDDYTWYTPDPSFTESGFSALERQNIDTIANYEESKGWI